MRTYHIVGGMRFYDRMEVKERTQKDAASLYQNAGDLSLSQELQQRLDVHATVITGQRNNLRTGVHKQGVAAGIAFRNGHQGLAGLREHARCGWNTSFAVHHHSEWLALRRLRHVTHRKLWVVLKGGLYAHHDGVVTGNCCRVF